MSEMKKFFFLAFDNGDMYHGEINDNFFDGRGKYWVCHSGTYYEGEWSRGKKCGFGELTQSDGSSYRGEFKNDKFDGFGILNFRGGRFEGYFSHGLQEGIGSYYYSDGMCFQAFFKKSSLHGMAIRFTDKGIEEVQRWENGEFVNGEIISEENERHLMTCF